MSDVLITELKAWQSGLGALLGATFGFVALVVGALFNYHLNRKRDAHLRADETLSVAAALYGEIVLLRREAALLARALATAYFHQRTGVGGTGIDNHFIAAYTPSESILYKALATKVGLLPPELVIAVTEFHANYQQCRSALPLLVYDSERGYEFSVLTVLRPARDAVRGVVPALRKIELMTAVNKAADDPDLGDASEAIQMEEDMFELPSHPN